MMLKSAHRTRIGSLKRRTNGSVILTRKSPQPLNSPMMNVSQSTALLIAREMVFKNHCTESSPFWKKSQTWDMKRGYGTGYGTGRCKVWRGIQGVKCQFQPEITFSCAECRIETCIPINEAFLIMPSFQHHVMYLENLMIERRRDSSL